MATELEKTRDHARRMAAWTDPRDRATKLGGWCTDFGSSGAPEHEACNGFASWSQQLCACACHTRTNPSAADRALWAQIADEIDRHLAQGEDIHQLTLMTEELA